MRTASPTSCSWRLRRRSTRSAPASAANKGSRRGDARGGDHVPLILATLLLASQTAAVRQPVKHDVVVDGHHFAVWQKRGAQARAAILLLHGRTWSSLPNFDLQVAGERRSFMDALADAGFDVF